MRINTNKKEGLYIKPRKTKEKASHLIPKQIKISILQTVLHVRLLKLNKTLRYRVNSNLLNMSVLYKKMYCKDLNTMNKNIKINCKLNAYRQKLKNNKLQSDNSDKNPK